MWMTKMMQIRRRRRELIVVFSHREAFSEEGS